MALLAEIFNSWQGEGGSVRGSAFGRRQIFVRFAGCDLRCRWCDSREFIDPRNVRRWRYEVEPFSGRFETRPNPATVDDIVDAVVRLDTGDVHSISYTGGEPTLQRDLLPVMTRLRELGFRNFLETHGGHPGLVERVADVTDYASVDIKDEGALASRDWRDLVLREVESLRILKDYGVPSYAKLVVDSRTRVENVRWYAELLKGTAPLVIQPAEPVDISQKHLMELYRVASSVLGRDDVGLSFQVHKYLNVL